MNNGAAQGVSADGLRGRGELSGLGRRRAWDPHLVPPPVFDSRCALSFIRALPTVLVVFRVDTRRFEALVLCDLPPPRRRGAGLGQDRDHRQRDPQGGLEWTHLRGSQARRQGAEVPEPVMRGDLGGLRALEDRERRLLVDVTR